MRIVAIRDIVSPIRSNIANAYIDFSQMTASVVAVVTDVKVDGKPVVGFGFNSNGRYAQHGLLEERFIPRLKNAKADSLLDSEGLIDPAKCWAAMMANEKPGGHGERSVAVGVLDMALWDAVAKAKRVPLWKLLADRYNGGKADGRAWVYAAGGYYYPGKDLEGLQDEMKHYLGLGYSCVKMKVGGVPLAEDLKRIEAVLKIVGGDGQKLARNEFIWWQGEVADFELTAEFRLSGVPSANSGIQFRSRRLPDGHARLPTGREPLGRQPAPRQRAGDEVSPSASANWPARQDMPRNAAGGHRGLPLPPSRPPALPEAMMGRCVWGWDCGVGFPPLCSCCVCFFFFILAFFFILPPFFALLHFPSSSRAPCRASVEDCDLCVLGAASSAAFSFTACCNR